MQIDINKISYVFVSILIVVFLILPHIKLYNFEATYFDLAIYINKFKFGISNFDYLTDHKELIILLLYPLFFFLRS